MPSWLRAGALQSVAVVLLFIVAWQIACAQFAVPVRYLPSPALIAQTIWALPGPFAEAVVETLMEAVLGIVGGTLVGIVSGILFDRVRLVERMLFPYFVVSQAVPIIAFGAIVIIWFGNGMASKVFIALYLTFFPVAVNTLRGLRNVSPAQVGLFRSFGANGWQIFMKLQFPAALPSIFTAIRLAASLGLVGAIVGEWFGAKVGLGVVLLLSMFNYQMADLWAGIVLTGLTGAMLYAFVAFLESRLAWWQEEL